MAESLDDAEFWLPPQFLADDDVVVSENPSSRTPNKPGFGFGFGFGLPDLSSPVESVVGSSEAESDEDDFLAGLTLRMSRSTLDDKNDNREAWAMSGSPQSTLCGQGSSRGSPNAASSRVSSPPLPATWDLLSAAAGEVAKIRTEQQQQHNIPNPNLDFQRHVQFEQLRQLQIMKQHHQQQLRYNQMNRGRFQSGRTLGLPSSAWPSLQQARSPQNGSGMRAVFLGNPSGGKRESVGTGVFLPRRVGSQPETRRKTVCSTVLLPARVVQALNLNLDEMGNPRSQVQPCFNGRVASESGFDTLRPGSNNINLVSYQKRNVRPQQQVNHEIRLPQDWTY